MGTLSKKAKIVYEINSRSAKRGAEEIAKATEKVRAKAKQSTADLKRMGSGAEGASGGVRSLTGSLGGLVNGATTAAAAAAAVAIGFSEVAEKAALSQVAIDNLPSSINRARGATMGLVDDLTLQQQAITANRLNVTQSEADFARLAGAATKLGLSVGQDATKSVQYLTTALARQSPMILDNLGITLKVSEANQEYAQRIGKVASELTDAERKQAFMTIGLERAEQAAAKVNVELDQSAQFMLELRTKAQNAGDYLSRGFVGALTNASNALEDTLGSVTGLNDELAALDALNGGRQFSFFNPAFLDNVEQAKELARVRKEQAADAALEAEVAAEIADQERRSLETQINSVKLQIAGTTNQRELNDLLSKEANLRSLLLDIEGKGAESERVLFQDLLRQRRFRARQGSGRGNGDQFKAEREAFEAQLRLVQQQEAFSSLAAAADRQRNADLAAYNAELAKTQNLQLIQGDRLRAANDALQRRNDLQQADLQRQVQLAELQGNPAEAFALEQQAFAAREEALRRRIDLETEVGERERLQDELAQARHERTISRIQEEQRQREQANAAIANAINSVSAAEQGAFQLSGTIAAATIQGEQRKKRALDGIKAAGLFADGAVASAQAAIAYASGNVPQGIALTAAAANAFAQGAVVAAGNARGSGGGGGAGTSAGAALGRGAPMERAQFNVDRGAPISVREGVEGNPNNTGSTSNQNRGATVQNIQINAGGTVDRAAVKTILKEIERFDGRAV